MAQDSRFAIMTVMLSLQALLKDGHVDKAIDLIEKIIIEAKKPQADDDDEEE